MGIAGTMEWDKTAVRKCPSCLQKCNTCTHVLFYCHEGRVEALNHTLDLLEDWLVDAETGPNLLESIMEYAHGHGGRSIMSDICMGLGPQFMQMARDQDAIWWRRSMEGMICKRMRTIQHDYQYPVGTRMSSTHWAQGLILKLLEAMHGQWIYPNIQIHDDAAGTQATLRKELIQQGIEEQTELGEAGLLEEDHWMMEVNLGDM